MLQLRINMPSAIWLCKLCMPKHQFGSRFQYLGTGDSHAGAAQHYL